jgi:RNA polymerase sigma factor (sigma-70 family)
MYENMEGTNPLTNAEILGLIKKYRNSEDYEARDKIVLSNIRFVYMLAHKYHKYIPGASFDDVVNEGVVGLIESIDRFDTSRENNFLTYAYWWILKRITQNITIGTLELPYHRSRVYSKFKALSEKYEKSGEEKTEQEICKELGISHKTLTDTILKKDSIFRDDDNSQESDLMAKCLQAKEDFENRVCDNVLFSRIMDGINDILNEREKTVIVERFGLGDTEPKTLEELADKLQISCEYVRIIQNKSLEKLKRALSRT